MTESGSRPLSDLLEDVRYAMVTTQSPEGLSSRPVTCADVSDTTLEFLVDRTADWAAPLENASDEVNVAFADPQKNIYVSVCGQASVSHDVAEASRLFNPAAGAFFDGPDDPTIGVLRVMVTSGQWWDGPSGRLRQAIALARTAISKDEDKAGDQGRVEV